MRKFIIAIGIIFLWTSIAVAQTNTPTSTATLTFTKTPTPSRTKTKTPTPLNTAPPTVGSGGLSATDLSAFSFETKSVDLPSISGTAVGSVDVIINGLQLGDLAIAYPPLAGIADGVAYAGCTVVTNNTLRVWAVNSTGSPVNAAAANWNILWFNRTAP